MRHPASRRFVVPASAGTLRRKPGIRIVSGNRRRRLRARRARGISLIELLAVVAITGILISSIGICLHGLYRADRRTRDAISGRSAISRAGILFREDAHASTSVRLRDQSAGVPLALVFIQPEGRSIEYHFGDQRITRTVRQADNVAHRDAFRLPDGGRVEWLIDESPTAIASAVIVHPPEPGVADSDVWPEQIDAAIGLGDLGVQREAEGDES